MRIQDDKAIFTTGKHVDVNRASVDELTPGELLEMADFMIGLWKKKPGELRTEIMNDKEPRYTATITELPTVVICKDDELPELIETMSKAVGSMPVSSLPDITTEDLT